MVALVKISLYLSKCYNRAGQVRVVKLKGYLNKNKRGTFLGAAQSPFKMLLHGFISGNTGGDWGRMGGEG